jgi:hypothetical protein
LSVRKNGLVYRYVVVPDQLSCARHPIIDQDASGITLTWSLTTRVLCRMG